MGGEGTVCLSHVVLGDYVIHNFNDEMHMRRAAMLPPPIYLGGVYYIHMLKMRPRSGMHGMTFLCISYIELYIPK